MMNSKLAWSAFRLNGSIETYLLYISLMRLEQKKRITDE